jgi:phosphoenolpyruvate carboxykinase (GTP)
VFLGSIMSSEKTAAAAGTIGEVRFDPFAMRPFCGYNVGEYFGHWLGIGDHATNAPKLPRLYWVNWFQKGDDGRFLWPGFGDNSRVVKWIIDRLDGTVDAVETPIGRVPEIEDLDVSGLDLDREAVERLVSVDADAWRDEVGRIEEHYAFVGERLPAELRDQLLELEKSLRP